MKAKTKANNKASIVRFSTDLRSTDRGDRSGRATEPELQRLTGCLHSLATRHHDLMQGYASRVGIACMQFTILTTIRYLETKGDVFLVTIAEYLRLTSAGVTKAIQHLTELGWVEKASDLGDRRRARLTVTQRGRAVLQSLAPLQSKVNDVWLDSVSEAELSIFLDLVERFVRSSDRALALQSYLVKESEAVSQF